MNATQAMKGLNQVSSDDSAMRVLTADEVDQVGGGFLAFAGAAGLAFGGGWLIGSAIYHYCLE